MTYIIRAELPKGGFRVTTRETPLQALEAFLTYKAQGAQVTLTDDAENSVSEKDLRVHALQNMKKPSRALG